jgi:hypothetical protein
MLQETEKRLKEITFFLYRGLELLGNETKHEFILEMGYDSFFGYGYMVINFSIPDLSELIFNEKSKELSDLMHRYYIESLDNINIRFKIRKPNDTNDDEEKSRLAGEQTKEIVDIVSRIFKLDNVFLTIKDIKPKK